MTTASTTRLPATETVTCNLCGADAPVLLAELRDLAFGLPGRFPLVRCRACGLMYLRERPTPVSIDRYYPPEYLPYRTAIQDERRALLRWARRRNVARRRRIVEDHSRRVPGRILDVGCSTGIFLDEMRRAGWDTLGIELSEGAVQYARQRFGLEVVQGQLLETGLPPGSFHAVTFWDVLEHTFDPSASLRVANRLLAPGGVAAFTLPHWESLDRRLFGKAWIGYDSPRHLYVFSRPVLEKLLTRNGFQILEAYSGLSGYFTFLASLRLWLRSRDLGSGPGRLLLRALELPGMRLVFQPAFSLLERLGLGGTLVLVARKVRTVSEDDHPPT